MNREERSRRDLQKTDREGRTSETDAQAIPHDLERSGASTQPVDRVKPPDDTVVELLRQTDPLAEWREDTRYARLLRRAEAIAGDLPESDVPTTAYGQIGRYRLLRKLGGHMGEVYVAEHVELKKKFAVKVLPPGYNAHLLARFKQEIQSLGRLDDPHVVGATDAGEEDGQHFIVMQFVDGVDLSRLVQRCGPVGVPVACELARQAALGLQVIHGSGIVHRDVKPGNLMLAGDGTVKVLDLGLARLPKAVDGGEELTHSHMILGTPHYMAPEQRTRPATVDHRADIYGLGCTLYKLLSGRTPGVERPARSSTDEMPASDGDPKLAQQFPHEVPGDVVEIVQRMMAERPEDRFPSVAEVVRVLQPWAEPCTAADLVRLSQTPIDAARDVVAAPIEKRRVGGYVWGALAGLAVVVALATWFSWPFDRQLPPPGNARLMDGLPAWQSHDLLDRPPRVAIWPEGEGVSSWQFQAQPASLTANCTDTGLLQWGRTQAPDFAIRTDIHQNRATAGMGVFFGLQETIHQGQAAWKYQALIIGRHDQRDDRYGFHVRREVVTTWIDPGGKRVFAPCALTTASITRGPPKETLEIKFSEGRLVEVKWGGRLLSPLTDPAVNGQFVPADYQGSFGALIVKSACVYTNTEFTLNQPLR